MAGKQLSNNQLLGEQGVSLIGGRVARMGYAWRPTSSLDSGIDGEIEIRDPGSGEMSGLLLKVQSKAVSAFANETETGFDFWPNRRDVDYWLKHNLPVILVVSRPATDEVYWQPVREENGQARRSRFHFDKRAHRFDENAAAALLELTRSGTPGARGFALKKPERLTSNLLPVTRIPERLYLAETQHRTPKDVTAALDGHNISFEFALRNRRVLTVRDLADPRFSFLCDRGTVEDFPSSEWSNSDDPDKQRDFVRLLNQCLRQFLRTSPWRIRQDRDTHAYYFPSGGNPGAKSHTYQAQKKVTSREVVKELRNKKQGHVMGYRHSAMWASFHRYGGTWYLELTPTYFFTQPDGVKASRFAGDWLSGIKRLERNNALLGQLVMWEALLTKRDEDIFVERYPFLEFGSLVSFGMDRGLDDAAWMASEEKEELANSDAPAGLFDAI